MSPKADIRADRRTQQRCSRWQELQRRKSTAEKRWREANDRWRRMRNRRSKACIQFFMLHKMIFYHLCTSLLFWVMHIADRVGSSARNYPRLTALVTSSCFQLLLSLLDVTHPGWNVFCQGLASGWSFPLPFSFGRRKGEGSFSKNGSVVSRARLGNCLFEQELEI